MRVVAGSADSHASNSREIAEIGDGWRKRAAAETDVRLTDQTLSCAARARVPKPTRRDTRLHVRRAMRVACRRAGLTSRAGSAGGPKPGRASFYGELGGSFRI
jgi:hypothetical protein